MKYGYFSAESCKLHGSVKWAMPNGTLVDVTWVADTPDPKLSGYDWPDTVTVGRVTRYVSGALVPGGFQWYLEPSREWMSW